MNCNLCLFISTNVIKVLFWRGLWNLWDFVSLLSLPPSLTPSLSPPLTSFPFSLSPSLLLSLPHCPPFSEAQIKTGKRRKWDNGKIKTNFYVLKQENNVNWRKQWGKEGRAERKLKDFRKRLNLNYYFLKKRFKFL